MSLCRTLKQAGKHLAGLAQIPSNWGLADYSYGPEKLRRVFIFYVFKSFGKKSKDYFMTGKFYKIHIQVAVIKVLLERLCTYLPVNCSKVELSSCKGCCLVTSHVRL